MPWEPVTGPEADEYNCHLFERLTRDDDGAVLGTVMQFHKDGAFYPIGQHGRYGPHRTLESARAAVESTLKPEDYRGRPKEPPK